MKKAYAVTSGQYSDYQVHALFASRELAEAWIRERWSKTIVKNWKGKDVDAWWFDGHQEWGGPPEIEEFPWYDDATPLGKEVQE